MTTLFTPTDEQIDIRDTVIAGANTMVSAYAGCAKTSTIEFMAEDLPKSPTLAVAFNVKIKKELEARLPHGTEVKTLNGLGHVAWARTLSKSLTVDTRKLGKIVGDIGKELKANLTSEAWTEIRTIAEKAMQRGMVPSTFVQARSLIPDTKDSWAEIATDCWCDPAEQNLEIAREAVIRNIKLAYTGTISFDDQIYMSALFGGSFQRFSRVIVDEAQDLSTLNHMQLRRVASGQIIAVGDPKQSIYAFRGADHESMSRLRALRSGDGAWTDRALTLTFRCPKIVVERQLDHAPGFRAWHTNPTGDFIHWKAPESEKWSGWNWSMLKDIAAILESKIGRRPAIAVLCRNNAPLMKMAFKFIREGVGVQMLGRDIGQGLVALSRKITPNDETPATECLSLIHDWTESELAKARALGDENKANGALDRGECLIAVLEWGSVSTAGEMRRALDDLFSNEHALITLSTGHRAKGLEWDIVLHLNHWLVPSRQARRFAADTGDTRALMQELNLQYVIETRTKHTLIFAGIDDFYAGTPL